MSARSGMSGLSPQARAGGFSQLSSRLIAFCGRSRAHRRRQRRAVLEGGVAPVGAVVPWRPQPDPRPLPARDRPAEGAPARQPERVGVERAQAPVADAGSLRWKLCLRQSPCSAFDRGCPNFDLPSRGVVYSDVSDPARTGVRGRFAVSGVGRAVTPGRTRLRSGRWPGGPSTGGTAIRPCRTVLVVLRSSRLTPNRPHGPRCGRSSGM